MYAYYIKQCFQVGWLNLVDLGPSRRLIMINRQPGRLIDPGRPCTSGHIPLYIYYIIYYTIHNKGSIKTALVFSFFCSNNILFLFIFTLCLHKNSPSILFDVSQHLLLNCFWRKRTTNSISIPPQQGASMLSILTLTGQSASSAVHIPAQLNRLKNRVTKLVVHVLVG